MPSLKVESDGLTIAAESVGTGSPILFAHGLSGNRSNVLDQFADQASTYRIITFDQRGHGESSPVTDPALYDPHRMAADVKAVADAYRIGHGIVGGESMGAATALLYSLRWPETVDALLLTVPAFGPEPNADRDNIREMGDLIERRGVDGYLAHAKEKNRYNLPDDILSAVRERLRVHDPKSLATACKTVIDWVILSSLDELRAVTTPTCIVAWKDDPLHPYHLAEQMAEVMPNATLVTHTIAEQFANPEKTGRIYADFLAGL